MQSLPFETSTTDITTFIGAYLRCDGVLGGPANSGNRRSDGARRATNASAAVFGQGLLLLSIGAVMGLAGAFTATRLMTTLLFGVTATDPLTYAGVVGILAVVSLLACYIPARRAAKVDPLIALRYDRVSVPGA